MYVISVDMVNRKGYLDPAAKFAYKSTIAGVFRADASLVHIHLELELPQYHSGPLSEVLSSAGTPANAGYPHRDAV